jgi:drug/metabolite transporter (DMT)-like permease
MLVNQGADRRQSGSARGALYGVLAVALNALGIVMVKPVLSSEIAFFQIALFRVAAALVAGMFAWPWLNGRLKQLNWRSLPWGTLILGAILGQYVSMLLWLGGYKFIDASVASILNETASIFILLFAWLLLGERLSSRKLLGVALTFAGVAVMMLS